jgi:hypothetical protein
MTTTLTPYAASKLANVIIVEAGLKAIPPQMVYNYTFARINAGKTPLIPSTREGVTAENITEWANKYVARKLAKNTTTEVEGQLSIEV